MVMYAMDSRYSHEGESLEVNISLFYLTKVAALIVYDGAFFMSKTLLFGSYLS